MRRRLVVGALAVLLVVLGLLVLRRGGDGNSGNVAASSGTAASTANAGAVKNNNAAATTQPRPRVVKMMFTGDTLVHQAVYEQARTYGAASGKAYDFAPMFDKVRPIVSSADVAICHQETALTPDDKAVSGYPVFSTPHEILDALKGAGYDGCSAASNHQMDRGAAGVIDSANVFDQVGLKQSGLARTAEEAATATVYQANGVKIAHLAYTYGLNGYSLPADKPFLVRLTDKGRFDIPMAGPYSADGILADAKAAKAAGADIVVITLHWGQEYQSKPTDGQVKLANQLLASPDIDLVVGSHVHVIQPIDRIGDKYVVYGLGNFLSNQASEAAAGLPAATQDGVIVEVDVTETGTGVFKASGVSYTPTWVNRTAGYAITPVSAALKDPATPAATKTALQQSLQRTNTAINALGAADKGVALANDG